ncbi:MAG: hypothetical protein JSU63_11820 [Phycisphaerales bacterium]|nr:MAG: hypothetical protein JSU63_11820 [Phycisphaerales bacterium]
MRSRFRRFVTGAGMLLAGGYLMAGPGTTCTSFTLTSALDATDTSFIFDCETAGGGVFDLTSYFIDCTPAGP